VVCDPLRPGRVYYGYFDIGLLISDDGGRSFRRSFQGMKYGSNCFIVAADPKAPSTLWAGTGWWDHNAGDVCLSQDDGKSWEVVGRPESGLPDGQTQHLAVDPQSPAGRRRLIVTCKGYGIYQSRDGGRSWSSINGNLPAAALKTPAGLLLGGDNPRRITVALSGASAQGGGVYTTLNSGRSWQRLHADAPFADIQALAADPRHKQVLYLAARQYYDHAAKRSYPGGLFQSIDGGQSWRKILDDRFVKAVTVDPLDSRVIYAGTTDNPYHDDSPAAGLLKSSDGGAHWQRENNGLALHNISCITVDPHDPATIYAGTAGNSVFIGSQDRGAKVTPAR
jgi:photosystem II stability/assembly factor-like uncharacterized protein